MQSSKRLIILYGPPGSGKGTQGELFKEQGHTVISSGDSIRTFTSATHTDKKSFKLAQKLKNIIDHGNLIEFADLKKIIEQRITIAFQEHELIFLEGIPRQYDQAEWLVSFCDSYNVEIVFVHLYVSLEEVIRRNSNRYYVPGSHKPFISYEAALEACPDGVDPIRRKDDKDVDIIKKRYKKQYSEGVENILSIFQQSKCSVVVNVDAQQGPEKVFEEISQKLDIK